MKNKITMSEFIEELVFDFNNDLIEMLDYELKIEMKKIKKEPLTNEEYIFDTYFIKPSTILRSILERSKNDK